MEYRDGKFTGVGSVEDFDLFEKALIKYCDDYRVEDRNVPNTAIPKIIIKPRLREVIEIKKSKVS